MIVSVKGALPLEQNVLESATKSPFTSWHWQLASTTDVAGSAPIRAVPHWSTL